MSDTPDKCPKWQKEISEILQAVLDRDPRFTYDGKYIRWGLVEEELNTVVRNQIAALEAERDRWATDVYLNRVVPILNAYDDIPLDAKLNEEWGKAGGKICELAAWVDDGNLPGIEPEESE